MSPEGGRNVRLRLLVEVDVFLKPGEEIATSATASAGGSFGIGSMPLLLTNDNEADGFIQSLTIIERNEVIE